MEILLINPRFSKMTIDVPLGLAYIAAVAREAGCNVVVVDMDAFNARVGDNDVLSVIGDFHPDLIGLGIYTDFAKNAYAVMQKISGLDIPVVVGGPHPTVCPDEPFRFGARYVVRGEGEGTFSELLDHLRGQKRADSIPGLSFVEGNTLIHNESRKLASLIDNIPFPAKDLFNIKDYTGRMGAEPFGGVLTSRGCPGRCVYCSNVVMGRKYRFRSAPSIIQEIIYLKDAYGIRKFTFVDDAFTANVERILSLLGQIIEEKLQVEWTCFARVNHVNPGLLSIMKEAGCTAIDYGIEHGDDASLGRLKKGISLATIEKALNWTKNAGLKYTTNYILGFPWETEETIKNTIAHAEAFQNHGFQASPIVPYPGTELFETYKEECSLHDWWLRREGITWQDIESIAKGRPLREIAFFDLTYRKEKLIEKGFSKILAPHVKFMNYRKQLSNPRAWLYWLLRFAHTISPCIERNVYRVAKSMYGCL